MMYSLPVLGRTLASGLAALVLVLGDPVCACAGSPQQSRPAEHCSSGETHRSASPSGREPVHSDAECSHCNQLEAQNAKIERAALGYPGSSAPVVTLTVTELVASEVRVRPLGSSSNLPPPRSSSDLLSLICTLRI